MFDMSLDAALLCAPLVVLLGLSVQYPKMHLKQSNWHYFILPFITLLLLRYASKSLFSTASELPSVLCSSMDQPNPIATTYPNNATGTLNGTISIIPITLGMARQLIPSQYGILEHAYRALLPSFPKGMYPLVVQALHDHDVQAFGFNIPDFSVSTSEYSVLRI
jgi:hypothetical protein